MTRTLYVVCARYAEDADKSNIAICATEEKATELIKWLDSFSTGGLMVKRWYEPLECSGL